MTAIRLKDVWFSYGEQAVLRGLSVAIRPGETVALVGRNGVGKTTLTKLFVGLLHPTRGVVYVGEQSTTGKAPEDLANWVAYVFQHSHEQLFARTVLDEVAFAPRQQGLSTHEAQGVAIKTLDRVGLADLASVHPYDLPPSHRKLVALAAALAQASRVLVLDEPTLGLDRDGKTVVCRIVREAAKRDVAVLAVSHDLGLVADVLERTLVLANGEWAYDGRSRDLVLNGALLGDLGLEMPPAVRLSHAIELPGLPVQSDAVAAALRERCRGYGGRVTSRLADDQP
jgi:energy-coupling factor transport system ATP-binding protein